LAIIALVLALAVWLAKKPQWSHDEVPGDAFGDRSQSGSVELASDMPHGFRGDIEGLRALAVLTVLLYHGNLGPFHGGYVGVDVFFVLSGFLITSLLMKDLLLHGAPSLPRFWARRARRLLPASCLVMLVTLIAARSMLDPLSQRDLAHDALAASAFMVNNVFAHRQSDYLASQLAPSPLLHFWSLALEEQFYIVWPFILLIVTGVRRRIRLVALSTVGVLWLTSLIACIWLTPRQQPWAFFSLPTRAWELLSGAGLALIGTALLKIPSLVRAIIAWVGLGGVVLITLSFNDRTHFPGYSAILPVLATVAIVAGSNAVTRFGPGGLLSWRPLMWIGQRSYAIYLWHWPALVLCRAKFGPLSAWQSAAVLVGSVVMADLSYRFVENPVRRSTWMGAFSRRGLLLGATLGLTAAGAAALTLTFEPSLSGGSSVAAAVLVTTGGGDPTTTTTTNPSAASLPVPGGTAVTAVPVGPTTTTIASATDVPNPQVQALLAANANTLSQGVLTQSVPSNLRPSLGAARNDKPSIYNNGCILDVGKNVLKQCVYGNAQSSVVVVLFGDSHAAQWFPALEKIATDNNWRLEIFTKKGCPTADIPVFDQTRNSECAPWRAHVAARLAEIKPHLIIISAYRYQAAGASIGRDPDQVWSEGLDRTMSVIRPLADRVLVLGDTPTPLNDVPSCVASHLHNVGQCMATRAEAVRPGRLAVELAVAKAHHADFATTSDWLCTPSKCPVVIGDLLVYRDNSHITTAASSWLTPYLAAVLKPLVAN
jgi:peptidoglycan/LPS O-acetylase OafA/YrhL